MIRVTMTIDLAEWWGADQAMDDGGEAAVIGLLHEDMYAVFEDAMFKIEKIGDRK